MSHIIFGLFYLSCWKIFTIINTKLPANITHLLIGNAYFASAPNAINVEEYKVPPPIDPAAESTEKNVINTTLHASVAAVYPGSILNASEPIYFI